MDCNFCLSDLVLTVVADEPHLGSPAPHQTAQQTKEDPLELVSEDAVDDEVDGAVDGDQQVVGLGQGVVLVPEMLTMTILTLSIFIQTSFMLFDINLTEVALGWCEQQCEGGLKIKISTSI